MLVVRASSICDVCLNQYAPHTSHSDTNGESNTGSDSNNSGVESRPHVVACGHVFCLRCLNSLRVPRTCPLCRAPVHLARAVRVHVDFSSGSESSSSSSSSSMMSLSDSEEILSEADRRQRRRRRREEEKEGKVLLGRLSKAVIAYSTATEDTVPYINTGGDEIQALEELSSAVDEARSWLLPTNDSGEVIHDGRSTSSATVSALRASLVHYDRIATLSRSLEESRDECIRLTNEQSHWNNEREHLQRKARKAEQKREQEARLASSQEKRWLTRVAEVERECERKVSFNSGITSIVSNRAICHRLLKKQRQEKKQSLI